MESTVCLLAEIPPTVDDDDLEEMIVAHIDDFSTEIAERITVYLDDPADDFGEEWGTDDDEEDRETEERSPEQRGTASMAVREEESEDEEGEGEGEGEDEDEDEDDDDEELEERILVITIAGIYPDEAETIRSLIRELLTHEEHYICAKILDEEYDDESSELDDEEEDEPWKRDAED